MTTLPPAPSGPPTGLLAQPPWLPPQSSRRSRWPTFATLVIALAAIVLAIGAWFRPLPDNKPLAAPPNYSDQQVTDAKASVCAAFGKVNQAVIVARSRSGGSDMTAIIAVATSIRQALDVGGQYLLTKLAEEPATPPDLANEVRKLASLYQELTVDYLADVSDVELKPSLLASDEVKSKIERMCK